MTKTKENNIKIVVVGDGAVGKTCLLLVYAKGEFPTDYIPTIFENYKAKVKINNIEHNIFIWDTAGQEELLNIRILSYPHTDVFVMCFSVVDRSTFDNLKERWIPEVIANFQSQKQPVFIICGTKADLRETTPPDQCISVEEAEAMTKQVGAKKYVESSAKTNTFVKEVFDAAIQQAISNKKVKEDDKNEGNCCEIA